MKATEFQPFYFNSEFKDFEFFQENALRWNLDFKKISKGDFFGGIQMLDFGCIQLTKSKLSGTIVQNGFSPKGYRTFILFADSSQSLIWLNNKLESKELIVYREDNLWESVSYDNFNMFTISIEQKYLNSVIEESNFLNLKKNLGKDERILTLNNSTLYNIQSFLNILFHKLGHNSIAIHSPNLQNKVIYKLPQLLLRILDGGNNNGSAPNSNRKRDKAINKALSYIENSSFDEITIPELCKYADVSIRTLEYGFQERFLISPKQYIKVLKLYDVRKEILNAKKRPVISEIAKKHGFRHMGQFSADYKDFFGELPSETKKYIL